MEVGKDVIASAQTGLRSFRQVYINVCSVCVNHDDTMYRFHIFTRVQTIRRTWVCGESTNKQ